MEEEGFNKGLVVGFDVSRDTFSRGIIGEDNGAARVTRFVFANFFTRSCTNLTYPIITHADCKSMNLIDQLQCTECNTFYIGETHCSLCDCMNGHHFTTTVRNHICQLPFTHNPTRSLSGLSLSYRNCQTPPQLHLLPIWKSIPTCPPIMSYPKIQHPLNPPFHTRASGTYNLSSVFSILLVKNATVLVQKFLLSFLTTNSLRARWHKPVV